MNSNLFTKSTSQGNILANQLTTRMVLKITSNAIRSCPDLNLPADFIPSYPRKMTARCFPMHLSVIIIIIEMSTFWEDCSCQWGPPEKSKIVFVDWARHKDSCRRSDSLGHLPGTKGKKQAPVGWVRRAARGEGSSINGAVLERSRGHLSGQLAVSILDFHYLFSVLFGAVAVVCRTTFFAHRQPWVPY